MNQNHQLQNNYEGTRDYSVLKNWQSYFETQINALTKIWSAYWEKGVRPEIPLLRVEEQLKRNFTKRDYCKNRIATQLPADRLFEEKLFSM
jgi:hypothetical protein